MSHLLKSILSGHNELASSGLLLMIVGGLGVYMRAVPEAIWEWFVGQTTMMITLTDDDVAFVWAKEWFLEQQFLKRIRMLDVNTKLHGERVVMIPAPGCHWFWYGDRPFQIWFSRTEDTRERAARRVESLTFRTIGRKRALLEQFVADVVACHTRKIGVQSCLFTYDDCCWDLVEGYAPRSLDSVVLKHGEKESLVQDIERFRHSKARYTRLGVPYHRGYLLYGPPGTGKTSLVSALAAHFALPIYCVNLSELNDRTLVNAINRVPSNAVVLFEDIDGMKSSNTREEIDTRYPGRGEAAKVNGVSLSGLLNVLDGFYAPSGVLFVMTTNHIELLDPALLRPGRIDYKLFMGKAERAQKVGLYLRFFPEASEAEAEAFVATHGSEATMAEFQGLLLSVELERLKFELVSA